MVVHFSRVGRGSSTAACRVAALMVATASQVATVVGLESGSVWVSTARIE